MYFLVYSQHYYSQRALTVPRYQNAIYLLLLHRFLLQTQNPTIANLPSKAYQYQYLSEEIANAMHFLLLYSITLKTLTFFFVIAYRSFSNNLWWEAINAL